MPKLPTYDARTRPQGQLNVRRVSGAELGVGQGLQAAGAGVQQAASILQQKKEQDARLWREKTFAEARSQWLTELDNRAQNAPRGAPGFTDGVLNDFNDYVDKTLGNAPTSQSRSELEADMARLKGTLGQHAMAFEAGESARVQREDTQQVLSTNANTVRADPSQLNDVVAQNDRLVGELNIPAKDKDTLRTQSRQDTYFSAINGRLDNVESIDDAQSVLDELHTADTWKQELSKSQYARALGRAQTRVNQLKAHGRSLVVDGLKDAIPEMEAGIGLDRESHWISQINSVIEDEKQKQEMTDRVHRAVDIGRNTVAIRTASPAEIMRQRAELTAQRNIPGDFRMDTHALKAFDAAVNAREQALEKDAAGYVLKTSPEINDAYEAMRKDPSPETRQAYVSQMLAEQQRLRGSLAPKNVLPNEYLMSIASTLQQTAQSPEGAQQLYQTLASEAASWGKSWPLVYGQLAREKLLSGPHLIAARMTGVDQRIGAENLLTASSIGIKELKKQIEDPQVETAIQEETKSQLADLQGTLAVQKGGDQWYSRFYDSTNLLATYYVSRGKDVSDAVQQAAKEIVNGGYTYHDTYRIPTQVQRPQAVELGARQFTYNIDRTPASMISAQGGEGKTLADVIEPPQSLLGLAPDLVKSMIVERIKDDGYWVTNPDETGLVMMYPGDEGPVLVRGAEGELKPLEFTWQELKDAPYTVRGESPPAGPVIRNVPDFPKDTNPLNNLRLP